MIHYYVIGCGGFAKEVYFLADEVFKGTQAFKGFIDYKPQQTTLPIRGHQCSVIDEDWFLANIPKDASTHLYIGMGSPTQTEKVLQKFSGYQFPNLVHPGFIGDLPSIKMGNGNIITAGCIFTVDISIGSYNIFNLHTTVGHDTMIGDNNIFNPGCNVSGGVTIGSGNLFGTNATVLQNLTIGNNNILGAAALANKSFDSGLVMIGAPAKPLVHK
jgi:sugar O-acyltransferase (sialic acid O-acetyltransferase NeuD family)